MLQILAKAIEFLDNHLIKLASEINNLSHPKPKLDARVAARQIMAKNDTVPIRQPRKKPSSFFDQLIPAAGFLTIGLVILIVAIVLTGIGVYIAGADNARAATLVDGTGIVYVSQPDADGEWILAAQGGKIRAAQGIQTGDDSWAVLEFHEGTQVVLYPDTSVEVIEINGSPGKKLQDVLFRESGKTSHFVVPFQNKESYYLVQE